MTEEEIKKAEEAFLTRTGPRELRKAGYLALKEKGCSPRAQEPESKFMHRCIVREVGEGTDRKQAIMKCLGIWKGKQEFEPDLMSQGNREDDPFFGSMLSTTREQSMDTMLVTGFFGDKKD